MHQFEMLFLPQKIAAKELVALCLEISAKKLVCREVVKAAG